MIIKFIADAIENCSDFEFIVVSTNEIHVGMNASEQLDPCTVEETIVNSNDARYSRRMSYEEKLKECARRVYSCNFSQEPKSTKKLKKTIDKASKKPSPDMNEDVDNIILTAINQLKLPLFMAERTKLIMARMWSYPDNFHDLKYENVVLGVMMYVVYEDFIEGITVGFCEYCKYMFGDEQAERNIRQMYQAYEIVHDLYKEVEIELACGIKVQSI